MITPRRRWTPPAERSDLPAVYADVEARKCGATLIMRAVKVWETLPRDWNKKTGNERQLWLEDYFRRALHLRDGDEILNVAVRSAPVPVRPAE